MFASMQRTPTQKGAIAEAALTSAATREGVVVSRPLSEGRRYDLIFDIGRRIVRVQAKWAVKRGAVVAAHIGTCRLTPHGYVRTTYGADEIDALGLYCEELDRAFLIPIGDVTGSTYVHLRLSPARNNQRQLVRYAAEYDLAKMVRDLGL